MKTPVKICLILGALCFFGVFASLFHIKSTDYYKPKPVEVRVLHKLGLVQSQKYSVYTDLIFVVELKNGKRIHVKVDPVTFTTQLEGDLFTLNLSDEQISPDRSRQFWGQDAPLIASFLSFLAMVFFVFCAFIRDVT